MTLLSEYKNLNRKATVNYRGASGDFIGIGYIDGLERESRPFKHETDAENWCEDFVLLDNIK